MPGHDGGALAADQRAWLDELAGATAEPGARVRAPSRRFNHDPGLRAAASPTARRCSRVVRPAREHRRLLRRPHAPQPGRPRPAARRDVPFVEVACTKDYPGAWAEYRVYEGGYTQVVRRVAAPAALAWSERGRTMIQGIYRDLVLGTIDDRCFTQLF